MNKLSFGLIVALMFACFFSALAVVYSQHKNRQLFVQSQSQQKTFDEMNVLFGRLQLEQSAWASYGRIESKAANELGMRAPKLSELQFVVRKAVQ